MRPSEALELHRVAIRNIVHANNAKNPRVFGSVVDGNDTEESDLDILVDAIDGQTTLLSLAKIQIEIEALTGLGVDVMTPLDLHPRFRDQVLRNAKPI